MKVGVWFKNRGWVENWFEDFLKKVDEEDILRVRKARSAIEV